MCLKFRSKKVRVRGTRAECGSNAGSEWARGVRPMISGELVSTSTRDRKPAQGRNRLDDSRLASAVFADEESDRCRELDIEIANGWNGEGIFAAIGGAVLQLKTNEVRGRRVHPSI